MSDPTGLLRLSALWHAEVGRRARRASLAVLGLAGLLAAHLGRLGTPLTRGAAALLLLGVTALLLTRSIRARRERVDAQGIIRRVLAAADPAAAARASRAHLLVKATTENPVIGSPELAELHFRRVVERVSQESVQLSARRYATRLAWGLLATVLAMGAVILPDPMRIVEGLDVLVARRGIAPLPLPWLSLMRVSAQSPSYLRGAEEAVFSALSSALPEGSWVSVRGVPERAGRHLVLTDGQHEVAFIDDGSGGVVARWKLTAPVKLSVAARFGRVLLPEADALSLVPLRDELPRIALEGAPRTLALRDIASLEFRYVAKDDHGLRQIDLVLRAGGREDRRTLVKLDGQSREEHGAHALSPKDPFLRHSFLPIFAMIQARDNDPSHGTQWGQSETITVVPPDVGEGQALRYRALRDAEDQLVGVLDSTLDKDRAQKAHATYQALAERDSATRRLRAQALTQLGQAVEGSYAGLRVSKGLSAFLLGQAQKLKAHDADTRLSEDALLAVDAGLAALSQRDASDVAKRLGDVAEEVADGAKAAYGSEQRELGRKRMLTALVALERGSRNLVTLGVLGNDVGSVALGEIRRIRRADASNRLSDVEAAARHLAARLRRPKPSFGAASGGGGGGVESGRGSGSGTGNASDADQKFDQMMRELAELAADHGEQINQVEGTLADSEKADEAEELKREAGERAARLRERLGFLPEPGALQGSARAAAAVAREHMSAMAQNLERLSLKDAVENGKSGRGQLDDARRLARDPKSAADWVDDQTLAAAERELGDDLGWAEKALQNLKERGAARASSALEEASQREDGMARRASNLAGRGDHGEAVFPDDVKEALDRAENAMRQAARELGAGRGEEALSLQREAQRLLEQASPGSTSQGEDDNPDHSQSQNGDKGKAATGNVPIGGKGRRSDEFRRRVLDGLSKERRGKLGSAVERYAEGLLE